MACKPKGLISKNYPGLMLGEVEDLANQVGRVYQARFDPEKGVDLCFYSEEQMAVYDKVLSKKGLDTSGKVTNGGLT